MFVKDFQKGSLVFLTLKVLKLKYHHSASSSEAEKTLILEGLLLI